MCGLTGWVDFNRDVRSREASLERMTKCLAHRGPDEGRLWMGKHAALGHRRLAIIDIEGGKQPMLYHEGGRAKLCLAYIGEAYNFEDVRVELEGLGHTFSTKSDTEVVLHGYLEWGCNVADHLNGMYSFAIWDENREELLLVRDRIGIKPLYYAETDHGIIFGSEPKAIFASGVIDARVDHDGICELLSLVRTPGAAVFQGLKEVKAGEWIRIHRRGIEKHIYWKLTAREHVHDLENTVKHVRALLDDITKRQLAADVPLCALLSGGLDSGLITALANNHRKEAGASPLDSFAIGFESSHRPSKGFADGGSDDVNYAGRVSEYLGTRHRTLLLPSEELLSQTLAEDILHARDLPPFGDIDGPLFLACREIRRHAVVALSGEGADEVFGGYHWLHDPKVIACDTFPWIAVTTRLGRIAVFEPRPVRELNVSAYQAKRYQEAIAEVPHRERDDDNERRMRELTYLHLTRFLPNPLDRKDRMSMAHGLEVRVPYCDHRLVEYVFNVPWSMKIVDGREKSLLRAAAGNTLPQFVLDRKKVPFPATRDNAYHERMRDAVSDLLLNHSAPVWSVLSRPSVRALAAMPPSGARIIRLGLERVLAVNRWLTEYRVTVSL